MSEVELRTEDSLQPVKYLGKVQALHPHGINVAIESVRIVWKRSKKGTLHNRCAISIHPFGLCLYEEIANGTYKSVWFDAIENISYCVAEPLHRRIFAWIARSQQSDELECHVVLCKTSKSSQILADLLAKTFYESYRYRQEQQKQQIESTPNMSRRCSVCDTIARQQSNSNLSSFRNHSHQHHHVNENINDEKQRNDDYENIPFQQPMIARAFVGNYEGNSLNNSSYRSIDYDITYIDEESLQPIEHYRRAMV
ncbi:unnamed protein product [Adineta ricciae]|uniref:PID domain-containing protein n=1 Tax=Adineta ricciae TaxID=249248 RepID=A0A813W5C8_ADIRI|nr:unnamed protein product [Adineta ricciae]CAF1684379.1 unnamed protein product [Adineta ricciae]